MCVFFEVHRRAAYIAAALSDLDGCAENSGTRRILAMLAVAAVAGGIWFGFSLHGGLLARMILITVVMVASFGALALASLPQSPVETIRATSAFVHACTFTGLAFSTILLNTVLAASALPLVDANLAAIDRSLGVDWPALIHAIDANAVLSTVLCVAYWSLNFQPYLLIALLALSGRQKMLSQFMLAWAIALAITSAGATFLPAFTGYHHFGIDIQSLSHMTSQAPAALVPVIEGVRAGTLRVIGVNDLAGIVAVPSFHTTAAGLLAWAYAGVSYTRWPLLALNIIMAASTVYAGGHYVVDVIAGIAVAPVAIFFATGVSDLHAGVTR